MIQDVLDDRAPPILVYGILALSARFSKNPFFEGCEARERHRQYSAECKRLLDLEDVSLVTVQACVLLGATAVADVKPAAESVYYAVAFRIAQLLDLPRRSTVSAIEKEVNIRVWWTLCLIDVWSATGIGLPRYMIHRDDVPLPMNERKFLQLKREDTIPVENPPRPETSLIAQMIKLNLILAQIYEINDMAATGRSDGAALETAIRDISHRLDEWQAALPDYMRDTPTNMARYASEGLGRTFVALYVGYYHYGQLLFYQFLHQDCHASVPSTRFYANKCKVNAARLCELLYTAKATPDCEVLYTMVGHILVISSTVQLYILLFGIDDEEIRIARTRLERNFEILQCLRTFWPTLDVCFSRLRAFHKACRVSMETSFRLDQWMLRFLSEFAQPVGDRYSEDSDSSSWRVENIVASPSDFSNYLS
ncbi:C6 transcription factor, putative [Talaromyces stipitatus ATCC 10500]|uniref:C6 transcription factor, putative n=1 Tax=Talaromyces stipitatus (strain ATCC 10500 / CBS 375.48 / QM 6759 / NRRL 1006) TaxID=441959 RepID=B8MJL4_TALSN|nr:C6 transcription factor, putative [Talaromyces stipitatus ATCC 10500]XP_002485168.1 C6 transcription factor, putative [Talaromyces stipitatus ATCC 10500]EED15214.1 C6 transcription factor, putative [Talaromyces stipitatus ATCC 10500]EED15215.1 C6 transcription factor, putative [Talaromyces stipitatus ATCC 10500]